MPPKIRHPGVRIIELKANEKSRHRMSSLPSSIRLKVEHKFHTWYQEGVPTSSLEKRRHHEQSTQT